MFEYTLYLISCYDNNADSFSQHRAKLCLLNPLNYALPPNLKSFDGVP